MRHCLEKVICDKITDVFQAREWVNLKILLLELKWTIFSKKRCMVVFMCLCYVSCFFVLNCYSSGSYKYLLLHVIFFIVVT